MLVAEEIAATLEREGPRIYGGGRATATGAAASAGGGELLPQIARLVSLELSSEWRGVPLRSSPCGRRLGAHFTPVPRGPHAERSAGAFATCSRNPKPPAPPAPQVSERDKDIRAAALKILEIVYCIEGDGGPLAFEFE